MSPESRIVALSSDQGLELWDLPTSQRLFARPIGDCAAEFDSAGRMIVAHRSGVYRMSPQVQFVASQADSSDGARASDRQSNDRALWRLRAPRQHLSPADVEFTAGDTLLLVNPAGKFEVQHGDGTPATLLNPDGDPRKSAISNDGRYAAIASWESGGATVWNASSGAKLADLAVGRHGIMRFSPDGQFLAATPDGISLWHTGDWRRIASLHAQGTTPAGLGIAFSPDSRVLAIGQVNGVVSFVDPSTAAEWGHVAHGDLRSATFMAFSPDQRWLITSPADEHTCAGLESDVLASGAPAARVDWPADVLRATTSPQPLDGEIEVVIEDSGPFDASNNSSGQDQPAKSAENRPSAR